MAGSAGPDATSDPAVSARTDGKRHPGGRPRRYTAAERAEALDAYRRSNLATAARTTGVPKSTLRRWAAEAGEDPADLAAEAAARTEAATRAAAGSRRLALEAAREQATGLLSAVMLTGLRRELSILQGDNLDGLHQVVGSRTRAIHDLALLAGDATENSELRVVLNVPRPDGRRAEVIPEARLRALPAESA